MTTHKISSPPITRSMNAIVPSQFIYLALTLQILTTFFMVGCSSSKTEQQKETISRETQTKVPFVPLSFDYRSCIPTKTKSLQSYSADCSVSMNLNDTPLQGDCTVDILRTDSLKMIINGPFGILVGKLSATNERLLYFDAMNMQVLEGNPTSRELQERLPIPLEYNDFIHLMRCEVPFESNSFTVQRIDTTTNIMLVSYTSDPRFIDFAQVNIKDSTLLTYQRKSRKDEVLFNINYSNHTMKNDVRFPNKISLQFPPRKMSATFTVTKLDVNPSSGQYMFNIPKNVSRQVYK